MKDPGFSAIDDAAERSVWAQDASGLASLCGVTPQSWAGAIQADLLRYGTRPPLPFPTAESQAAPDCAILMMVKDESDIIEINLNWHYFVGFRKFVVIDNNSNDRTPSLLRSFSDRFPNVEMFTILDPVLRYTQAEKTTGMYHFARSVWPELRWAFPLDADEFLIPTMGLQTLEQAAAEVTALTIPKSIHFRHRINKVQHTASPLLKMGYRSPLFAVPPKVVVRSLPGVRIEQGNHQVTLSTGDAPVYDGAFRYGIYIREFPTRSFEHLLRKIQNGGPAIQAAMAYKGTSVGGAHWLKYYDLLLNGGEQKLLDLYETIWVRDQENHMTMDPFGA